MLVKETMQRVVRTCREEDSLAAAACMLWEHDCGCAPVVDGVGHVTGMITDRDICRAAFASGRRRHDDARVVEFMAKDVATVRPEQTLAVALATMRKRGVRRLPVIDAEGLLVGLLSNSELCRWVDDGGANPGLLEAAAQIAATMARTGRPRSPLAALVWCAPSRLASSGASQ